MNFSSVVIKRIFLEAKVTRQVHLNPTEISFVLLSCGCLTSPRASSHNHCIDGPWSVAQWNTAECIHVWSVRVFRTEQMKENETKTRVFIKWRAWTKYLRGCLSVTGSLNRFKGWLLFRFVQQKFQNIKNDYSQICYLRGFDCICLVLNSSCFLAWKTGM